MERWSCDARRVSARVIDIVTMVLAVTCFSTTAHGGLILGSNQLGEKKSIAKDGAVELSLDGFNGRFFGQPLSRIWLAENGYLSKANVSGDDFFSDSLTTNTDPRIANFWDDVFVISDSAGAGPQQGIFFSHQPGQYVAATWSQVFLANDLVGGEPISQQLARSFQTVWFGADTILSNFQFRKDDIAMGFSGFSAGNIDATVGIRDEFQFFTVDDVSGRTTGLAPGGVISTTNSLTGFANNAHLLPWEDESFLLFRAVDDEGGNFSHYRVSIESFSAIPEPASWTLLATGAGLTWWLRRRLSSRVLVCQEESSH